MEIKQGERSPPGSGWVFVLGKKGIDGVCYILQKGAFCFSKASGLLRLVSGGKEAFESVAGQGIWRE